MNSSPRSERVVLRRVHARVAGVERAAMPNKRSTVIFPYVDLDNAVAVACGVVELNALGCEHDSLAVHLAATPKTVAFRMRIACARTFGLVSYSRNKPITLTDIGRRITDPAQQSAAKAEAFLEVPLYQKVFDRFCGGLLPPREALDRALISFGVGQKVVDRARQVLVRSARQAGYFDSSHKRLARQPLSSAPSVALVTNEDTRDEAINALHPLVISLALMLPKAPAEWPIAERLKWLNAANSILDILYPCPEKSDVEIRLKDLAC